MVTFAFLGNTLFLTILVSMLSNTFATIVSNATAEVRFRKAVLTLEGVKSDAIFAYQPPFNLIAVFVFLPLKFIVSPRWFHKIHVFTVRTINLPLLLIIALAERRLWQQEPPEEEQILAGRSPQKLKWWERWLDWRITTHGDLGTVFEIPPPESIREDIHADDDMTRHLIRRQFARTNTSDSALTHKSQHIRNRSREREAQVPKIKPISRRDSMFPQLAEQVRGAISTSTDVGEMGNRLIQLEQQSSRIEGMLEQLCDSQGLDLEDDGVDTPGAERRGRSSNGSLDGDGVDS